jgi:hypothetical protein
MLMNESELEATLRQAVASLFVHQPNIFEFTSETGQTEWNLAHHLAVELSAFLPSLEYDLDVAKKHYGNKRPDMVFHKRGTHKSNYLVIEMKRNGSPAAFLKDVQKIKRLWFRKPLKYRFGAVINLRPNGNHQVQVFKNAARR